MKLRDRCTFVGQAPAGHAHSLSLATKKQARSADIHRIGPEWVLAFGTEKVSGPFLLREEKNRKMVPTPCGSPAAPVRELSVNAYLTGFLITTNRGDKTAIELFLAGVQGWDLTIRAVLG